MRVAGWQPVFFVAASTRRRIGRATGRMQQAEERRPAEFDQVEALRGQGVAWREHLSPSSFGCGLRTRPVAERYEVSASGRVRLGFLLSLMSLTQVLRLNAIAAMCA